MNYICSIYMYIKWLNKSNLYTHIIGVMCESTFANHSAMIRITLIIISCYLVLRRSLYNWTTVHIRNILIIRIWFIEIDLSTFCCCSCCILLIKLTLFVKSNPILYFWVGEKNPFELIIILFVVVFVLWWWQTATKNSTLILFFFFWKILMSISRNRERKLKIYYTKRLWLLLLSTFVKKVYLLLVLLFMLL